MPKEKVQNKIGLKVLTLDIPSLISTMTDSPKGNDIVGIKNHNQKINILVQTFTSRVNVHKTKCLQIVKNFPNPTKISYQKITRFILGFDLLNGHPCKVASTGTCPLICKANDYLITILDQDVSNLDVVSIGQFLLQTTRAFLNRSGTHSMTPMCIVLTLARENGALPSSQAVNRSTPVNLAEGGDISNTRIIRKLKYNSLISDPKVKPPPSSKVPNSNRNIKRTDNFGISSQTNTIRTNDNNNFHTLSSTNHNANSHNTTLLPKWMMGRAGHNLKEALDVALHKGDNLFNNPKLSHDNYSNRNRTGRSNLPIHDMVRSLSLRVRQRANSLNFMTTHPDDQFYNDNGKERALKNKNEAKNWISEVTKSHISWYQSAEYFDEEQNFGRSPGLSSSFSKSFIVSGGDDNCIYNKDQDGVHDKSSSINTSFYPLRPDDRCERKRFKIKSKAVTPPVLKNLTGPSAKPLKQKFSRLKRHLTLPNFKDLLTIKRPIPCNDIRKNSRLSALHEVDESVLATVAPAYKTLQKDSIHGINTPTKTNRAITPSLGDGSFKPWCSRIKSKTIHILSNNQCPSLTYPYKVNDRQNDETLHHDPDKEYSPVWHRMSSPLTNFDVASKTFVQESNYIQTPIYQDITNSPTNTTSYDSYEGTIKAHYTSSDRSPVWHKMPLGSKASDPIYQDVRDYCSNNALLQPLLYAAFIKCLGCIPFVCQGNGLAKELFRHKVMGMITNGTCKFDTRMEMKLLDEGSFSLCFSDLSLQLPSDHSNTLALKNCIIFNFNLFSSPILVDYGDKIESRTKMSRGGTYFGILYRNHTYIKDSHIYQNFDDSSNSTKVFYKLMRAEQSNDILGLRDLLSSIMNSNRRPCKNIEIMEGLEWMEDYVPYKICDNSHFSNFKSSKTGLSNYLNEERSQRERETSVTHMNLRDSTSASCKRPMSETCDSGIVMIDSNYRPLQSPKSINKEAQEGSTNNDTNNGKEMSTYLDIMTNDRTDESNIEKNCSSPSYGSLEIRMDKNNDTKNLRDLSEFNIHKGHYKVDDESNSDVKMEYYQRVLPNLTDMWLSLSKSRNRCNFNSCPNLNVSAFEDCFDVYDGFSKSWNTLLWVEDEISDKTIFNNKNNGALEEIEKIWIKRASINREQNMSIYDIKSQKNHVCNGNVRDRKKISSLNVKFNSWGSSTRTRRISSLLSNLLLGTKTYNSERIIKKEGMLMHEFCPDLLNSMAQLNTTRTRMGSIRKSFRLSSLREKGYMRRRFKSIPNPKPTDLIILPSGHSISNFVRFMPNFRHSIRSFVNPNPANTNSAEQKLDSTSHDIYSKAYSGINQGGLTVNNNDIRKLSGPGGGGSLGTLPGSECNNRAQEQLQRDEEVGGLIKDDWFESYFRNGSNDRISRWALSFDNLLKDPAGLKVFTEFLIKEYSEENIEFWKECEQFRNLPIDDTGTLGKANSIYHKYLSDEAPSPVNVNAICRQCVKERMINTDEACHDASPDLRQLFDLAQGQIYSLMRYDSYPRFIKSDTYKNLVMREIESKPLTFLESMVREPKAATLNSAHKSQVTSHSSHDTLDDNMKRWKTNLFFSKSKLDNLLATALNKGMGLGEESRLSKYSEDLKRRRKGLADLVPIKVCKDDETTLLIEKDQFPSSGKSSPFVQIESHATSINISTPSTQQLAQTLDETSRKNSPSNKTPDGSVGLDNYLLSHFTFQDSNPSDNPKIESTLQEAKNCVTFHIKNSLFKSYTNDASDLVIKTIPKESEPCGDITIKSAILHICKIKGLDYSAVDVFTQNEPIDLNVKLGDFMGKDIVVEQRVLFQIILLPSGKSLGVKTRPNKLVSKVINPILEMYGMSLSDDIDIYRESDGEKIHFTDDVLKIDKSSIIICPNYSNRATSSDRTSKESKGLLQHQTFRKRPLKRSITIDIDGPPNCTLSSSITSKMLQVPHPSFDQQSICGNHYDLQKPQITIKLKDIPPTGSTEYFNETSNDVGKDDNLTITPPNQEFRKCTDLDDSITNPSKKLTDKEEVAQPYYTANANNNNSNIKPYPNTYRAATIQSSQGGSYDCKMMINYDGSHLFNNSFNDNKNYVRSHVNNKDYSVKPTTSKIDDKVKVDDRNREVKLSHKEDNPANARRSSCSLAVHGGRRLSKIFGAASSRRNNI